MNTNLNKKNNINNRRLKFIIPFIIFLIGLSCGSYFIFSDFNKSKNDLTPEVKQIIEDNKKGSTNDKHNTVPAEVYNNELPNYRSQYGNQYIMGKLSIPELKIDSLITRASNNSYYLDHNIYNSYDLLGTPFFDYRNTSLATDRQINIYGHNTENEKYYSVLPFTNLEAYTDYQVFSSVKNIVLDIDEKRLYFKVIATKIVNDSDNEHMKLIFFSDQDYLSHVSKLLSNTLYRDDVDIKANDRLLVLQACHFNPRNSYLLVIAKCENS